MSNHTNQAAGGEPPSNGSGGPPCLLHTSEQAAANTEAPKSMVDSLASALDPATLAAIGKSGQVLCSRAGEPPAQLPGESDRDYTAFVYYFRLRPTTQQKLIAAALGLAENRMSEIKRKWSWDSRIAGYLAEVGREDNHSEEWLRRRDEISLHPHPSLGR